MVGTQTSQTGTGLQVLHTGINLLIAGAWAWLYWPVASYLSVIFTQEDFRTNQIVLLGVLTLILLQMRRGGLHPHWHHPPRFFAPGLALALGGAVLYLLVERFVGIRTLSALLCGVATYGLLGLWMGPARWWQGIPAALLVIGTLPFGDHIQTFVGYPMRIATAMMVRDGLAVAGVPAIGVDTILVLENGVSQVDLPCSGVKSLWTGLLFLMAATWIERRPLSWRWLGIATLFLALLFGANLVRVGTLVVVGQVAGWRLMAEMIHVPLGVLAFVAACGAALLLLRQLAPLSHDAWEVHPPERQPGAVDSVGAPPSASVGFGFLLLGAIFLLGLIHAPRPETGLTQPPLAWDFPHTLQTQPVPLKPDESMWLTRDGAESADRRHFRWGNINGSMILIPSTTWRAHHRPERCFEVYGLQVDDSYSHLARPDFPLRVVALRDQQQRRQTAVYWFQSHSTTTDDYVSRIWADLRPDPLRWVLVSVVFEGPFDPASHELQALYAVLHTAVAHGLATPPADVGPPTFPQ